jgi:hypothetical protein
MEKPRRRWLLLALSAVLAAGPLVHEGYAKRGPKSFFKAVVNGNRLKASKRGLLGALAGSSFSVAGATKPRRGVVRTVTVNCGPVDLPSVPPSTTLTGCFGSYTEKGTRESFRQWTSSAMELTVGSFDGSRLTGSFRGALADASTANPSDAVTSIEEGTFSLVLTDLGV